MMGRIGTGLFLVLSAWFAGAQPPTPRDATDLSNLSLEELMNVEVVYGASRYAQPVSEAPSSVTIITAADIKQYGYRTLADILRSVRGFYITYDRNYAYVGVRGFGRPGDYNTRVLVLVDGHRINDNVYDSVLVENGFVIDIDLIERVEVVRGPNFSIYGTSAFFPVIINIITQRGTRATPEVSAEASSFGTYSGRAGYGRQFASGLDIVASGSLLDSRGQDLFFKEFDTPGTNNGVAVHADDEYVYRLFGSATYKDLSVEVAHSEREKGIPTASFGTVFNDRRTRTWDGRSFLDLKLQHAVGADLTVFGRAYYDRATYRGDYAIDYPPVTLNRDTSDGEWWGLEALALYTGLARNKLVFGGEFEDNTKQQQRNYDLNPPASYLDVGNSGSRWAVLVQDEVRLLGRLILNIGVRHDWSAQVGGKDSPRVALIYNPATSTSVRLLFGRAFRPANQYELFYATDVPRQKPNPGLKPETIQSYDLVVDQALGKGLRLTTSAFLYRIENLITYTTDPLDGSQQFQNAGDIRSKGFEVEVGGEIGPRITGRASYSFQETRSVAGDLPLTNSPRHMVKLNLAMPIWGGRLKAGLEGQYTGPRLTIAGTQTGGFSIANLTVLAPRLTKRLDLSASVYNLFDKKYADPGSEEHIENVIPQDGRSFRLRLTWRL